MPRILRTKTVGGTTIRNALISARDAQLPDELASDTFAQWILHHDSLESGQAPFIDPQLAKPLSHQVRIGLLFKNALLEQACTFYFSSLFHIGRRLRVSEIHQRAVSRLMEASNFDNSVAQLSSRLNRTFLDTAKALKRSCDSDSEYQLSFIRETKNAWKIWRQEVNTLQFLMSCGRDWVRQDRKGAGVLFLIWSRGLTAVLDATPVDRAWFRLVRLPSTIRFLGAVSSSPRIFYELLDSDEYWSQCEILLPILENAAIDHDIHVFARISEKSGVESPIGESGQPSWLSKPHGRLIAHKKSGGRPKDWLHDVTKLFTACQLRPPIWPSVKVVSNTTSATQFLGKAGVSAKDVIYSFADDLTEFSKQFGKGVPYIPLANPEWDQYVDKFFNSWWVPNLARKGSILKDAVRTNVEERESFAELSALLLDRMGYAVNAPSKMPMPPGVGGDGKERGRFRPFQTS
jgi:hypothetical protein